MGRPIKPVIPAVSGEQVVEGVSPRWRRAVWIWPHNSVAIKVRTEQQGLFYPHLGSPFVEKDRDFEANGWLCWLQASLWPDQPSPALYNQAVLRFGLEHDGKVVDHAVHRCSYNRQEVGCRRRDAHRELRPYSFASHEDGRLKRLR